MASLLENIAKYEQQLNDSNATLREIRLDPTMGPGTLREVRFRLSDLYADVRPILGWTSEKLDQLTRAKKQADKTMVVGIEALLPADIKLTEKLREAHVAIWMEANPLIGMELPIGQLIDRMGLLQAKAESMTDIINEKSGALITAQGTFKTEASLT